MPQYNQCPKCGWWGGYPGPDTLEMPCPLCKTDLTLHSLEYITRELWEELHMMENPTEGEFAEWCSRVPDFGCQCRHHLNNFIEMTPVDYDNFAEWAIKLHNHINRCTGKPQWQESSTVAPEPSSVSAPIQDATPSPTIDTAPSTDPIEESELDPTTLKSGSDS